MEEGVGEREINRRREGGRDGKESREMETVKVSELTSSILQPDLKAEYLKIT